MSAAPCAPERPCGCDGCPVTHPEVDPVEDGCGCACSPEPEPERCVLGCGAPVDDEGRWCGGYECRAYALAEARGLI